MPAVQLARLKIDLTRLSAELGSPARFRKALTDFLEQYSDRTYRAGQVVMPTSQVPSYHVPALVTQQLRLELRPYCLSDPNKILAAIDILQEDKYREALILASFLLGQVPPVPLVRHLDRLERLALATNETGLRKILLNEGTARLRCEQPAALLERVESWLGSSQVELQRAALSTLVVTTQDRSFENLPAVFRLAGSVLQNPPNGLQPQLVELLTSLVNRSSQETLYFAKQAVATSTNIATTRLVRRLMPLLSPEGQSSLRSALLNTLPEKAAHDS